MRKLVLAVLIAACGTDSGGPIGIDNLDQALIDRYCATYVQCGVMPDEATCQAYFAKLLIQDHDIVDAVKAGKVIYHGDKASQCIDLIGGNCDRNSVLGNRTNGAACDDVYDGTVAAGGACAMDEECISQVCTKSSCGTSSCCQGTCADGTKPVRGDVGATCADDGDCNGSFCDAATMKCTAYLADGSTCNSSTQCESAVCTQTCLPLVEDGGTCTMTAQCKDIADSCNAQHVCSKGAARGATCATSSDCASIDRCDTTMHCSARPARGDACTTTYDCVDDSYCDPTMHCAAPLASGSACRANADCSTYYCDTGTMTCGDMPVCI